MGILPEGMRARLRQLANKAYPAVAVLSSARRAIRLCAVSDPTTAPARRPSTFASYLSDMERWPYPPEGTLLSSDPPVFPGWRGVVLRYVRGPALLGARTTVTRAAMIARRGRRLEPVDGELRLHLASGDRVLPGWHNIDLAGSAADFLWDLRRPLPVAPGSVTAVFSEHFMEHVPLPAAAQKPATSEWGASRPRRFAYSSFSRAVSFSHKPREFTKTMVDLWASTSSRMAASI